MSPAEYSCMSAVGSRWTILVGGGWVSGRRGVYSFRMDCCPPPDNETGKHSSAIFCRSRKKDVRIWKKPLTSPLCRGIIH